MGHKEKVLRPRAKLLPWEEAVGTVESVETFRNNVVISIFTGGGFSLEIPLNELMKGGVNLVQLKGRKISILRTDDGYILKQSKLDDDTRSKVL